MVDTKREEIEIMNYEMPAIADTVDLQGDLGLKVFSIRRKMVIEQ